MRCALVETPTLPDPRTIELHLGPQHTAVIIGSARWVLAAYRMHFFRNCLPNGILSHDIHFVVDSGNWCKDSTEI